MIHSILTLIPFLPNQAPLHNRSGICRVQVDLLPPPEQQAKQYMRSSTSSEQHLINDLIGAAATAATAKKKKVCVCVCVSVSLPLSIMVRNGIEFKPLLKRRL